MTEPTTGERILVLPSPLLGPAAYGPLAQALGGSVAGLPTEPFTPAAVLDAYAAQANELGATVLVPHSNAGFYAPALVQQTLSVEAVVAVDAALPRPSGGLTALAPAGFLAHVHSLAEHGLLPPWTSWWPREEMAQLFPDAAWFERVAAAAPRLPLAYFEGSLPCPSGWTSRPTAYLALSDAYPDEVALASESGWPVERLDSDHLAILSRPEDVAAAVRRLLTEVRGPTGTAPSAG